MVRKLLFASAGAIALVVVLFALGGQPAARADTSSIDWDLAATDIGPTANDPICASDTNNKMDVNECPTETFTFVLDTSPAGASTESFFDLAAQIWTTGPEGTDIDGDTLLDPSSGIVQIGKLCPGVGGKPCLTLGTTGVEGKFSIRTALVVASASNNNIDDIGVNNWDTTVQGQPAVCGGTNTFAPNNIAFYLWQSTISNVNQVSVVDDPLDPGVIPQSNEDNFSFGQDCTEAYPYPIGTPNGMPDGIDCTPDAIPIIETALGLPVPKLISRAFGVSMIPVLPPMVYVRSDINFLVYNMVGVPEIQGYISFNVVNYPGLPAEDPTKPGYDPTGTTASTCPPFTVAVTVYGITQDSDFDMPPDVDPKTAMPREVNRQVVGAGDFAANIFKSVGEDWDGDTTANHYDRCRIDPDSGKAAQDTDGDTLTGLCENPTGMTTCVPGNQTLPDGSVMYWNCEGAAQTPPGVNNPQQGGSWNIVPPWDTGQDVDGDGYLNTNDNCPNIPDRNLDGVPGTDYQQDTDADEVGDVCEISLAPLMGWPANAYLIPSDGSGYPGRSASDVYQVVAPGKFVDRDNVCSDPFSIGAAEPALDAGRWCAGMDAVPAPNVALLRQLADSNDDGMPDLLDHPASAPAPTPTAPPAPTPTATPAPVEWPDIEWMDVDSDTDFDGHSDACEGFVGTDPLDASSVPGSPAIADPTPGVAPFTGDCDGDTIADPSDSGSDPFTGLNPDADGDGCTRSQELPGAAAPRPGSTAAGGVSFQDSAWYDFFDVPIPARNDPEANGPRNKAVNLQDVVGVLKYVGTARNGPTNGKVDYDSDKNIDTVPDGVDYDRSPSPAPTPPKDAGPPSGAINLQDVVVVLGQVGLSCV